MEPYSREITLNSIELFKQHYTGRRGYNNLAWELMIVRKK